ncbi:MAG: hypothetical protein AAF288_07735 [Planctomycetota bacterium]
MPVLDGVLDPGEPAEASAVREWVSALGEWLGADASGVVESPGVRMLGTLPARELTATAKLASSCITRLQKMLGERAFGQAPGGAVIVSFTNRDHYYRYVSAYTPEGEQGESAGMMIGGVYPHIALWGRGETWQVYATVAHEMLHLAMHGVPLPLWLEEGLAQLFEADMETHYYEHGASRLDDIRGCQAYWRERGLEAFWAGYAFYEAGDGQKYSYLLGELLVRGLVARYGRRKWFRRKEPTAFERFVWACDEDDDGARAAREELGQTLEEIAGEFLER